MKTPISDDHFCFGLEAEYLICNKEYSPLWYKDITYSFLMDIFCQISLTDLTGNLHPLTVDPPNKMKLPYIVEGYHLANENGELVDIHPKGIEIRTPVNHSIEGCLLDFQLLFQRLKLALGDQGYHLSAISHHPLYTHYKGEQGTRETTFWKWAMSAMTTYGPDINIRPPTDFLKHLDIQKLHQVVDYYIPSLTMLSFASPFYKGELWMENEKCGYSYRSYKRTLSAPAIIIHGKPDERFEFKTFEMSNHIVDYHAYFLISLVLLLGHHKLKGRADPNSRIYELGGLSYQGFSYQRAIHKLEDFFTYSFDILREWGIDSTPLMHYQERLLKQHFPALDMISQFQLGIGLEDILKSRSDLQ